MVSVRFEPDDLAPDAIRLTSALAVSVIITAWGKQSEGGRDFPKVTE